MFYTSEKILHVVFPSEIPRDVDGEGRFPQLHDRCPVCMPRLRAPVLEPALPTQQVCQSWTCVNMVSNVGGANLSHVALLQLVRRRWNVNGARHRQVLTGSRPAPLPDWYPDVIFTVR